MPVVPVLMAGVAVDIATPPPSIHLAGVSMAGFHSRAEQSAELRIVPHPALTIFLDFGDAVLVDDVSGERRNGAIAMGLAPAGIRGSGRNVDLLQVRLSPLVAHAALGSCAELGGSVVALEDLWGRETGRLQERLHAAGSWDARFAIARDALIRRCIAGRTVDPEVTHVWRQIMGSRGQVRVEQLADEVGWSRKRLWSRFGSQIGLTPKRAATLVRFDHVAHRLAAGQRAASVAADSGFVDQSHLNRDVMTFAGMTPTAVADAPWLSIDDIAWAATEHTCRV